MLTRAQLKTIFPKALDIDIEAFVTHGQQALKSSGILDGINRLHYFLAQLGHESNGLTHKEEGLSYSASRLMQVWPSRFPTLDIAKQYERNPEKLANFVYGGRMGNVSAGDGYKFRGRGYIQLTGRETYREVGKIAALNLETEPDLAAKPEYAIRIACAYWTWKGLNKNCDAQDFTALTKRINGGTNGITDRIEWLGKVQSVVKTIPTGSETTSTPIADVKPEKPAVPTPKPKPTPMDAGESLEDASTMANNSVLAAQKKLKALGYYAGVFDGIYNQMLRTAIWAFQKDEDLPLTGRLDARTIKELNVG